MTVKISNLPAATSVGSGDVIPVVQSGTTKKIDLNSPWNINIDGGNIDGTPIGVSSASSGAFTTLDASQQFTLSPTGGSDPSISIKPITSGLVNEMLVGYGSGFVFDVDNRASTGLIVSTSELFNDAYPITFKTGASEAMRIDSNGRIGIGTTSPSTGLHINKGSAERKITFSGFGTPAEIGMDDSNLIFNAGGLQRMHIASGGNVGIGTTSPSVKLDVNAGAANVGIVTRSSDAGSYVSFVDNTTTNESSVVVGAVGNDLLAYAGGSERMRIDSSGHAIIPAGVTLGTSAGVYNAANTLDDYEEGTWTPIDTSGAGLTFTINSAIYTKIGRICYFQVDLTYPSTASSSNTQFTLPFTNLTNSGACFGSTDYGSSNIIANINANVVKFRNYSGARLTNATVSNKSFTLFGFYAVS